MQRDAPDEELMLRYRDGDAQAFETLYARHKGGLYRFILRQCRDPAQAEELFQEVWMNLIRARKRYTVQAKFATYLYRLAHNRVIDFYRSQAGGVAVSFDAEDGPDLDRLEAGPHEQPDRILDRKRRVEHVVELLDAMPGPQREVFLLREEAGLSVEEIAEATGVNRETAKSRLRYAFARLKLGLKGDS